VIQVRQVSFPVVLEFLLFRKIRSVPFFEFISIIGRARLLNYFTYRGLKMNEMLSSYSKDESEQDLRVQDRR